MSKEIDALEITKSQFMQYVDVQESGSYNMFDPRARAATTLSHNQWVHIISNYDDLNDKFTEGE